MDKHLPPVVDGNRLTFLVAGQRAKQVTSLPSHNTACSSIGPPGCIRAASPTTISLLFTATALLRAVARWQRQVPPLAILPDEAIMLYLFRLYVFRFLHVRIFVITCPTTWPLSLMDMAKLMSESSSHERTDPAVLKNDGLEEIMALRLWLVFRADCLPLIVDAVQRHLADIDASARCPTRRRGKLFKPLRSSPMIWPRSLMALALTLVKPGRMPKSVIV